jgi:hypothetical protein
MRFARFRSDHICLAADVQNLIGGHDCKDSKNTRSGFARLSLDVKVVLGWPNKSKVITNGQGERKTI